MNESSGVSVIETRLAPVTVSGADPVMPSRVALMLAVPAATPITVPVASTLVIAVLSECQLACKLRFCVVPSLKVPIGVREIAVPGAMDAFAGPIEIETRVAFVVVSVVEPLIAPALAVMVLVPTPWLIAIPLAPMMATAGFDEPQVTS